MKLGIWTPRGGKADQDDIDDPYAFAVQIIQQAELYGFDVTLVAQRFLGDDLEAWILASALAARTSRIQLMVAVHPGIIPPQTVAKMGATLDRISGGRFAVNFVNGWFQQEMEIFGNGNWIASSDDRYRRMDEFLAVTKGMWTEEKFTFHGQFFNVEDNPIRMFTKQVPHPPVYAASKSDVGQDIIAKRCEFWFVDYPPGHRLYEESFERIKRDMAKMRARADAYGRAISFGISATVIIDEKNLTAEAEADRLEERLKTQRIGASTVMLLGAGLVGSARTIADRIQRYEEAGIECFMLRFPEMASGLDRFRSEIMPLIGRATQ